MTNDEAIASQRIRKAECREKQRFVQNSLEKQRQISDRRKKRKRMASLRNRDS